MRIGLQIPDFTWPGGPEQLGPTLATIARTADSAGFEYVGVMDHFFQIPNVGPAENEMLEAYTTLGYLAAHTERVKLLTVVTGAIYRHPGILGKTISTLDVLSGQIAGSIPAAATAANTVVAYEPVWAIGTGLTPTADDVAAAHAHIRRKLTDKLGSAAAGIRILYGGSVKPSNAVELLGVDNVDGALVGGASLKAADFLGIAEAYRSL